MSVWIAPTTDDQTPEAVTSWVMAYRRGMLVKTPDLAGSPEVTSWITAYRQGFLVKVPAPADPAQLAALIDRLREEGFTPTPGEEAHPLHVDPVARVQAERLESGAVLLRVWIQGRPRYPWLSFLVKTAGEEQKVERATGWSVEALIQAGAPQEPRYRGLRVAWVPNPAARKAQRNGNGEKVKARIFRGWVL